MYNFRIAAFLCSLFLALSGTIGKVVAQSSTRYYVNQAVDASGDGKSWGAAFKTLQEAIDIASDAAVDEIWVAKGIYYPSKTPAGNQIPTSKHVTFYLGKHMKIYGGFKGDEAGLNERNWQENVTTLSGDMVQRGNPEIEKDSTRNAYHVVVIVGTEEQPMDNRLVLDGFTITEGYAYLNATSSAKGETIYGYWGGGILNINASPVLNNLFIYKNTGFVGGGIHNMNSSPVISNSVIASNGAPRNDSGGGIYNNLYSSPLISNVTIRDNFASSGGGMYNTNLSSPVVTDSEFLRNVATNTGTVGLGGAICNNNGSMKLTNVVIENNKARMRGAGIYNRSGTDTRPELNNVRIRNNSATADATFLFGAGIFNTGQLVLTINGGEISGNTSINGGGGIYAESGASLTIRGTTISNNQTRDGEGGGIAVKTGGTIEITDAVITGNRTARTSLQAQGGGFYSQNSEKVVITGGRIENNYAQHAGGGIYLIGTGKFTGVTISDNETASGGGGAAFSNARDVELSHLVVSRNVASSSGGIQIANAASLYAKHLLIEKNRTTSTPYNGYGGGITFSSDLVGAVIEMSDIIVRENQSGSDGGGIYIYGSKPRLDRVTVSGNTAIMEGGGLSIGTGGDAILTNALITGNKSNAQGGGLYVEQAAPFLTNLTIAGNEATSGGGIYASSAGNLQIRNTIVHGNSSGLGFVNGVPKRLYSMIQDRTENTDGNIASTDPLFAAPATGPAPFTGGDYHLQNGSPLKDKGNNDFYLAGQTPDLSTVKADLEYLERIYNGVVDLGAYEFGAGPLPVTLVSFRGEYEHTTANLAWQTSEESNASHFEIQRSPDAKTWITAGEVPAAGESAGPQSYFFTDQPDGPLPGILYYRLHMIDRDGTSALSNIISLRLPQAADARAKVRVYPNPAADWLYIDWPFPKETPATFQLLTMTGQLVLETRTPAMRVEALPSGIYLLRTRSSSGMTGHKVLITK